MKSRLFSVLSLLILLLSQSFPVSAEAPRPDQVGPADVKLGTDLATLKLPKGFNYLNAEHVKVLLEKYGDSVGGVLGMVGSADPKDHFSIMLRYTENGYVEDNDGDKLNADEILKSFKEGTEQQNEERKKRNIAPMHVVGWDVAPRYEKAKHVVIWSLKGEVEGEADPIVNYNTRVLGRKGVLEVNLICDQKDVEKYKPEVGKILDNLTYSNGQRYEDHQSGDKISAGGIAALVVGGIALKKLGVLAFLASFFKPLLLFGGKMIAAFGKGIVVLVAGVVGGVKSLIGKLSGRKDNSA
jgi:uncharacterized membrane-anchored protein